MNRIVRENYPVSKLPEDLREGFEGQADVRVTIDAPEDADAAASPTGPGELGHFSRFKHLRRSNYATIDEINAYVRSLRDEWADRER